MAEAGGGGIQSGHASAAPRLQRRCSSCRVRTWAARRAEFGAATGRGCARWPLRLPPGATSAWRRQRLAPAQQSAPGAAAQPASAAPAAPRRMRRVALQRAGRPAGPAALPPPAALQTQPEGVAGGPPPQAGGGCPPVRRYNVTHQHTGSAERCAEGCVQRSINLDQSQHSHDVSGWLRAPCLSFAAARRSQAPAQHSTAQEGQELGPAAACSASPPESSALPQHGASCDF